MATVSYFHASWVDSGETGLIPGGEHHWVLSGFGFTDVVSVIAAPLNSDVGDQKLIVKDIVNEASPSGGRGLFFTVRNTGPVRAIGYGMNFSFISA